MSAATELIGECVRFFFAAWGWSTWRLLDRWPFRSMGSSAPTGSYRRPIIWRSRGRMLGRGPAAYWRLPTLCWLNASDWALHALCWGGMGSRVALFVGILPGLCAALLWLFYLSLVVGGQDFLGFQWDSLLLEAGLLAVLLAPWGIWLGRARDDPWAFTIWLVRWLVFRLMFLSGVVKLASQDPAWSKWKALEYHYQTQPLPTWTSWYIHQMPPWFHGLSVGLMFFAELVAPFFVVGPEADPIGWVRAAWCSSGLDRRHGQLRILQSARGGALPDSAGRPRRGNGCNESFGKPWSGGRVRGAGAVIAPGRVRAGPRANRNRAARPDLGQCRGDRS